MIVAENGSPLNIFDLALLDKSAQPSGQLRDHLVLEISQFGEIDPGRLKVNTPCFCLPRLTDQFGNMQQRFRRDAAVVETNPAGVFAGVDQGHLFSKVCRCKGRRIPARPCTDHRQLCFVFSHEIPPVVGASSLLLHRLFQKHRKRLLEAFANPSQKPCGVRPVDDPVIIGQRQGQDLARSELSVVVIGQVDDRLTPRMAAWGQRTIGVKAVPPMPPWFEMLKVPPCISSGFIFLLRARSARSTTSTAKSEMLLRSAFRITGTINPREVGHHHSDMDIFFEDEFLIQRVDTGIELTKFFQRLGADSDENCGDGEFGARFSHLFCVSGYKIQ